MRRRVAIVGAGASGLTAIRQAVQYDFEPVAFEMAKDIGGLWRFKPEETDEPTVMKSTVINTSKEMTAYSDFPPPKEFANFMHNTQMLEYMRLYAEHFNLLKFVKFGCKVQNIERGPDFEMHKIWKVYFNDPQGNLECEDFDAVLLCTGHHTEPYWPTPWDGQKNFSGRIIHSHSYKDHRGYEDKVVVVIGIGNSGGDIAVELSRIAKKVYLVSRRGSWVHNRIFDYGLPFDIELNRRVNLLVMNVAPRNFINWYLESKLQRRFDHELYGLKPKHRVFSAHVTVNDELPNRIACGTIVVKPNLVSFLENGVVFEDGSTVVGVDEVIVCTGYSFRFPLLESGKLIPVVENEVELYEYMYPLNDGLANTVAVIGLIQPLGSISPISEMQTRVFFDALIGRTSLPSVHEMRTSVHRKKEEMSKRFVKSRRHTIQVDYIAFMDELASLIGAKPNVGKIFLYDPLLALKVLCGPNLPYVYRLQGPFVWAGAREAIMSAGARVVAATQTKAPLKRRCMPLWLKIFVPTGAALAIFVVLALL